MPTPEIVLGIQIPAAATLKVYGLTRDEWVDMLEEQNGECAVCAKVTECTNKRCKTDEPHGHLHTHHQHVAKWKKMAPERRKTYVIALVCQFCNRFVLSRTMTLRKARNIVKMLEAYDARRS